MIGYLLIIFLIIYFGAAFLLPSIRVWKKTGVNPVTFRGADNTHDYIGKLFKILITALAAIIIIYAFAPDGYLYLLPVFWLEYQVVQLTGLGLLLISLVWTVIAQVQMGRSWRIGIDEEKATALVQKGLFRFSRNPIFLGMIVTLTGVFLSIPNAFTLSILILGFVLIQLQVRLEEEFLFKTHGLEYEKFRQKVNRWF